MGSCKKFQCRKSTIGERDYREPVTPEFERE